MLAAAGWRLACKRPAWLRLFAAPPAATCMRADPAPLRPLPCPQHLGVNVDTLLLCQPDSGEMALEVADSLIRWEAGRVCVPVRVCASVCV